MKIGILTSGGDAPGMNACVINLIKSLSENNQVYLVLEGFKGLLDNSFVEAKPSNEYDAYYSLGGSFIYSSRCNNFVEDIHLAINNLQNNEIDCLIVIGGSGSYEGAKLLKQKGIKVLFIPATIDNDINISHTVLGFSSATQEIVNDYFKIKNTFKTHKNICFIEVMGRHCKDLATTSFLATDANYLITHSNVVKLLDEMVSDIKNIYKKDQYAIILVSEYSIDGTFKNQLLTKLKNELQCNPKWLVLGHLQRGVNPNYIDLNLAKEFAIEASNLVSKESFNKAIVIEDNKLSLKEM